MSALLLALLLTQPVPAPLMGPSGPVKKITGCTQTGTTLTCTGGGGGAPTDAPYVTTGSNATLSAEVVLPTCGGTDKLTFNGTTISCGADQDTVYSLPDATSLVTGGVRLTGDLGGTATSPTVPGLAGKASSTHTHVGGDVTSAVGSATALAVDPTACAANNYVTDIAANGTLTCSIPPGTYTLPAASTTLGGVKMAAACAAGNHVSSIGAGGELTCTADAGGGGGSPGGSTTQVQYNNAGAFGGMARVTTDGNDAILTGQTTHPAAPSAGFTKLYGFQHHGSTAPAMPQFVDGNAQMEVHPLPFTASFDYRWGCLVPAGAGNALLAASGFAPPSGNTTGTAAAVAWAVTDERTRHSWVQYPSAATASSSAGVRANADVMWRGNAAGLGGFYWWGAMNIVTTTANQRVFMGLKDATAVITATTNPSASLDTVYFGCDAGQTTLRICSNDNVTAATCTDLGANFPCTTANVAYDVALWAAPNASSIGYYIRRLVTGSTASGTISTDLPRNTVALGWDLWINNGGTAAASTMQFGGACYVANP